MARFSALVGLLTVGAAVGARNKFRDRASDDAVESSPVRGSPCSDFSGTWQGYFGKVSANDSYLLSWRGGGYPQGSFTSVYINPGQTAWSLGIGQLSPDNTTATITFDNNPGDTLSGNVTDACTTIEWDNGSQWRRASNNVKKIHMISMNHLDVGYNGIPGTGLINNVLNQYFGLYFPRAVAMVAAMKARGGSEQFIYTTHAWLVDLYVNCPPNLTLAGVTLACPSPPDAAAFADAVRGGDIVFHAAPFNIQYGGAASQDMLDAIFAQPKRVAAQLGVPAPVVASLRDVPGAPRSIIPGLVRNGIAALTIGVNDYAPSPLLPTPCVWVEPSTNTSIVLMRTLQGQGYPDNVGPSPTDPGGLGAPYCVAHPASSSVLCFAFRTDNSGPPESVAEILNQFDIARWQWPGASVVASTFDAWWAEFQDAVPALPVVSAEMGETWITGFAADPPKNAFYRAAAREYSACLASAQCDPAKDPRITGFLRLLMKMPEHTWGLPSIYDDANYTNVEFHAARAAGEATYVNSEASWAEQRAIGTVYAMQALGDHPLAANISAAAAALTPSLPNPAGNGYVALPITPQPPTLTVTLPSGGSVQLALDGATGALSTLAIDGVTYTSSASYPLGRLVYQTVNQTDVDAQKITVDGKGCCCCYGWGNMQAKANPESGRTTASLTGAWASQGGPSYTAPVTFLAQLSLPAYLNTQYGAPAVSWVGYTVNADGSVGVEVQLFNKTATRLGEALYLDFSATPTPGSVWLADVLGHYVDPLDVVSRGSQRQHGVGAGVVFVNPATGSGLAVDTLDAPIMSPWTALNATSTMIVPFDPLAGPVLGFASVLFANIYNTNFPLYSVDASFKLRFVLRPLAEDAARAARAQAALKK